MLSEQHAVTVCTDPRRALSLLEEQPYDFDVVFCDLMMPYMSGMELYRRATAHTPALDAGFVFMTGAAIDPLIERFLRVVQHPRLEKPFAFETLSKLVEQRVRARAVSR